MRFRDKVGGILWINEPKDTTLDQSSLANAALAWAQALEQWPVIWVPVQNQQPTQESQIVEPNALVTMAQDIWQPAEQAVEWAQALEQWPSFFDKIEAKPAEKTITEVPPIIVPEVQPSTQPEVLQWAVSPEVIPIVEIPWETIEVSPELQPRGWIKKDITDIEELLTLKKDNALMGTIDFLVWLNVNRPLRQEIKAQTKDEKQVVGAAYWQLFYDNWISMTPIKLITAAKKSDVVEYSWSLLDMSKINDIQWHLADAVNIINTNMSWDVAKFDSLQNAYNLVQHAGLPEDQMVQVTEWFNTQVAELRTSMENNINSHLSPILNKTFTYDEYVKFINGLSSIGNIQERYNTKMLTLTTALEDKITAINNTPTPPTKEVTNDSVINVILQPIAIRAQEMINNWTLQISSNELVQRMWNISRTIQDYNNGEQVSIKTCKDALKTALDNGKMTQEQYDGNMNFINTTMTDFITKNDLARTTFMSYIAEYQLNNPDNSSTVDSQAYANNKFKQNESFWGKSYVDYIRSIEPTEYNFWYKTSNPFVVPKWLEKSDKDIRLSMVGAIETNLWEARWGLVWTTQNIESFVKKMTNSYLSPILRTATNLLGKEINPVGALDQSKILTPINFSKEWTPAIVKLVNTWQDIDDNVALTLGAFLLFSKLPALDIWLWDIVWQWAGAMWEWFKATRYISNATRFLVEAGPVNWMAWGLISAGMNELYNAGMVKTDLALGIVAEWFQSLRKIWELTKQGWTFEIFDQLKNNDTRRTILYKNWMPTEKEVQAVGNLARNTLNDLQRLSLTDPALVQQTIKVIAAQGEMSDILTTELKNKLGQIGTLPNGEWKTITQILDDVKNWEFKLSPATPTDPILVKLYDDVKWVQEAVTQNPNMWYWELQQRLWVNRSMLTDDQKKYVQSLLYEVTDTSENATDFLSKWYNNKYIFSTLWDWESSIKSILQSTLQEQNSVKRWVLKYWLIDKPLYNGLEVTRILKKLELDVPFMDDIKAQWVSLDKLFDKVPWYSDAFKISDDGKKIFTQMTKWNIAATINDIPKEQAVEIATSLWDFSKEEQSVWFFKTVRDAWISNETVDWLERSNSHTNINNILQDSWIDLVC